MTNSNDLLDAFAAMLAERMPNSATSTEYVAEAEILVVFGTLERARRAVRRGDIVGALLGRRVVVRRVELARFVDAHAPNAPAPKSRELSAEEIATRNGYRLAPRRKAG